MFEELLGRVIDQGGFVGLVAALAGWGAWKLYLFFDGREAKLRADLETKEKQLQARIDGLQVALTETSSDAHRQLVEAHEKFTNRLLSLVTSDAETRERVTHALAEMSSAMKRIQGDREE